MFLVVSKGTKLYAAVNVSLWIWRLQYFGILHNSLVPIKYPKKKEIQILNFQQLLHSYRIWLKK